MNKLILLVICVCVLGSCGKNSKSEKRESKSTSVEAQIRQIPDTIDFLRGYNKDSLKLLVEIVVRNINVVDNRLVFPLTKEELMQRGFSEKYYDKVVNDLEETNNAVLSLGIDSLKEMVERSYKELWEIYGREEAK